MAVKAFIHLHSVFFTKEDVKMKEVKDGTNVFISVLEQIVELKEAKKQKKAAKALTILADIFPRIIGTEYERIEKVFPNRKINFAYSPDYLL